MSQVSLSSLTQQEGEKQPLSEAGASSPPPHRKLSGALRTSFSLIIFGLTGESGPVTHCKQLPQKLGCGDAECESAVML